MHIGTMVEFAFALVGKLDVINKHSFNDFKLRVGMFGMRPDKIRRKLILTNDAILDVKVTAVKCISLNPKL